MAEYTNHKQWTLITYIEYAHNWAVHWNKYGSIVGFCCGFDCLRRCAKICDKTLAVVAEKLQTEQKQKKKKTLNVRLHYRIATQIVWKSNKFSVFTAISGDGEIYLSILLFGILFWIILWF